MSTVSYVETVPRVVVFGIASKMSAALWYWSSVDEARSRSPCGTRRPLETSGRLAATGSGVVVVVEEHIVVGLAVVVLTRAVGFIGVIVGHVVVGEPCWLKDHFS
jgi:hypothetical protein